MVLTERVCRDTSVDRLAAARIPAGANRKYAGFGAEVRE
jgi:hypothetical protein